MLYLYRYNKKLDLNILWGHICMKVCYIKYNKILNTKRACDISPQLMILYLKNQNSFRKPETFSVAVGE